MADDYKKKMKDTDKVKDPKESARIRTEILLAELKRREEENRKKK